MINDMDLGFVSTSVPHHTEIANVLINASSSVVGFDIEGSSISVDGIGTSKEPGTFSFFICLSDHFMISSYFSFKWSRPEHQRHHCIVSRTVFTVTLEQSIIEPQSLSLSPGDSRQQNGSDSDLNMRVVLNHPS